MVDGKIGHDAVADVPAVDAGAERDDLTTEIGAGDNVILDVDCIHAPCDQEVAVLT